MEVGMSLLMNGTSRERGLRGAGGTAVQDRGSSHRTSPPSNPTPVPAMIQWLLRVLAQTWKSCVPGPRVPPVVIGGAHQRWRWRSRGSHHPSSLQRPVYRHHPPNICCIQGLAFVVLKMAWELTRQRWIRTINSKYIYGLVVGFHPLSRALPRDVDGLDDGGQAGATSCPSPSAHHPSGRPRLQQKD